MRPMHIYHVKIDVVLLIVRCYIYSMNNGEHNMSITFKNPDNPVDEVSLDSFIKYVNRRMFDRDKIDLPNCCKNGP